MGEHQTWFDLLPGYHNLEEFLRYYLGREWSGGPFPPQEHFSITHVVLALLVALFLIGSGIHFRRKSLTTKAIVPDRKVTLFSIFDMLLDWIYDLIYQVVQDEHHTRRFYPVVATVFLYILFANLIGLIPGLEAPTSHLQMNMGMALTIFVLTHYFGIKEHGWKYLKQFTGPVWYAAPFMIVIELIGHIARPFSLMIRLLGNMFADHKVITIFTFIFPLLVPIPFQFLGLLVAFVQAFVFALLSVVYFSMAVAEGH